MTYDLLPQVNSHVHLETNWKASQFLRIFLKYQRKQESIETFWTQTLLSQRTVMHFLKSSFWLLENSTRFSSTSHEKNTRSTSPLHRQNEFNIAANIKTPLSNRRARKTWPTEVRARLLRSFKVFVFFLQKVEDRKFWKIARKFNEQNLEVDVPSRKMTCRLHGISVTNQKKYHNMDVKLGTHFSDDSVRRRLHRWEWSGHNPNTSCWGKRAERCYKNDTHLK